MFGQVGERHVKRFHGPDTPPQEIRRVHSSARINQKFGPRGNVTSKMVDKLQASKLVRTCGSMYHAVKNLFFEFSRRLVKEFFVIKERFFLNLASLRTCWL